ncbi:uncharacterized protein LOC107811096 isoform X1 [Nicotiana tabacum]|uniref:Nucleolin 2 isoform X1 n=2 Tax=Nicotiana TaxID=4085 RepID=A0A1S4BRD2_TOBAC|nr:PREDICTED: nucleolin 2-like isoform X1 [Nicotiana sylvestris]XP_016491449.1 PREDICTED: nucleolin 2-like isoform X1 [Nicotiana tabacum]
MPPKAASVPRWRRKTIMTARKSIPKVTKSTGSPTPSPSTTTADAADVITTLSDELSPNSTNSKGISEQSLISQVPETTNTVMNIGETTAETLLSSPEDKKLEIEAAGEQKVGVGKKKVVKKTVRIVKKIVKKKVPKSKNKESVKGGENSDRETVSDSLVTSSGIIESETEILEPTTVATVGEVGDPKKGDHYPVEVEKGTIVAAEDILGNDGMKDCEVSVSKHELELPISDAKGNIGSLETGNVVLHSEKGNLRPVKKIVKKIVKKKVPKLKSTVSPPETENLESCKAVSANGELSMKYNPHPMEVEKATNVSATQNTLEPLVLEFKETTFVETADTVSQAALLDSEAGNLNVSTSDNLDSCKDQNLVENSQSRDETMEAADTSLRLNQGIVLSGELEALERKKRRRTEIFIGGLDKETKEGDIRRIFEEVGEVVDVIVVTNRETGKNKGFAFVRFASAADAKKAVERYSKVEISGKQCSVSLVEGNDTIYLGNIDRKWKTEDVIDLLKKAGIENIDKVTVMANPNNIEQNRGFAFVELETNKEAKIAFNKLQKKDVFGKNMNVKVAWAQPLVEPNEEEMLKVKSVYAEYLPSTWNEEKVRDYFVKFGEIESVVLAKDLASSRRKDFAFVNYISRESALACIEAFSHEPVNESGSKVNLKVSLAKPVPKNKQTKRATVPTKREPREVKIIQDPSISKRNEPNKKVNYMRRYTEDHRVNRGSSATNELLHLLRQQAPAGQIHSGSGIDHRYLLSRSKRPLSAVVDNPHRMDSVGVSRLRLESSFPTASQSMLSHSRGPLATPSFAYYRQLGSGQSPGSVYGVGSFPSSFQSQERGPYGGHSNIYRRY